MHRPNFTSGSTISRQSLAFVLAAGLSVLSVSTVQALPTGKPVAVRTSVALDDPTIVAIFDAANTWDIETGALGARKGHDKEVREYGRMLVRDHKAVRQQGRDLAKRLGVHPTPPKDFALYNDHVAAMKKLKPLRGEAFDKAFLANEVAYHKAVIDAINNTLMPAIQNADLKALVVKVAPAFNAHMVRAQSLLDAKAKEKK